MGSSVNFTRPQYLKAHEGDGIDEMWCVCVGPKSDRRYLHTDGIWRKTTKYRGKWSGFFPKKSDAAVKFNEAVKNNTVPTS